MQRRSPPPDLVALMTVPPSSSVLRRAILGEGRWLRLAPRAMVLAAALFLAGCLGSRDDVDEPLVPERPAAELYNEGLVHMQENRLRQAIESFAEVDRQHPYTDYARKAMVMSAFANFRQRDYDTAVTASERFLTLYPQSPDAAYAHYIIAESYFRQVPDVTRDQEATRLALAQMQLIVDNYPDSEYAPDARSKIIATRDQLAGKEMQIGRYYLERREYIAAVNRFKLVVTDYQNTRHVEEALERLTEGYLAMGLATEAQTAAAVLGHNFPDSPWYQDAFKLLQSGGLEPRENNGSWISQAFRAAIAG